MEPVGGPRERTQGAVLLQGERAIDVVARGEVRETVMREVVADPPQRERVERGQECRLSDDTVLDPRGEEAPVTAVVPDDEQEGDRQPVGE